MHKIDRQNSKDGNDRFDQQKNFRRKRDGNNEKQQRRNRHVWCTRRERCDQTKHACRRANDDRGEQTREQQFQSNLDQPADSAA